MRPPLMIALAVALGATLWLSSQDDGSVEPVKGGERRSGAASANAPRGGDRAEHTQGTRRARTAAAAPSASAAGVEEQLSWEHHTLIDGVHLWQQRTTPVKVAVLAPKGASAWASMLPPPPPPAPYVAPPPPPPPPPPVAPPFPHKWIGRYNDETADAVAAAGPVASGASGVAPAKPPTKPQPIQRAVVAGPTSTWVLKEGDVIEGQWRVDRIDNRTMYLTYLPLNLPQTVAMN
jgi:hypothetical protein